MPTANSDNDKSIYLSNFDLPINDNQPDDFDRIDTSSLETSLKTLLITKNSNLQATQANVVNFLSKDTSSMSSLELTKLSGSWKKGKQSRFYLQFHLEKVKHLCHGDFPYKITMNDIIVTLEYFYNEKNNKKISCQAHSMRTRLPSDETRAIENTRLFIIKEITRLKRVMRKEEINIPTHSSASLKLFHYEILLEKMKNMVGKPKDRSLLMRCLKKVAIIYLHQRNKGTLMALKIISLGTYRSSKASYMKKFINSLPSQYKQTFLAMLKKPDKRLIRYSKVDSKGKKTIISTNNYQRFSFFSRCSHFNRQKERLGNELPASPTVTTVSQPSRG